MRSNYSGGVIYFRLSAAKGDRDGLFNLGMAYDNGWVPDHPRDKVGGGYLNDNLFKKATFVGVYHLY